MLGCIMTMDAQRFDPSKTSLRSYSNGTRATANDEGKFPTQTLVSSTHASTLTSQSKVVNDSNPDHTAGASHLAHCAEDSSPPLRMAGFLSFLAAMDTQRYDLSQGRSRSLPPIDADVSPRTQYLQNDSTSSIDSPIVFANPSSDSLPSLVFERDNFVKEIDTRNKTDESSEEEDWTTTWVVTPKSPPSPIHSCFPRSLSPSPSSFSLGVSRFNCLGSTNNLDETKIDRIVDYILKRTEVLTGRHDVRVFMTTTTETQREESWRMPIHNLHYGKFAGGVERVITTIQRD